MVASSKKWTIFGAAVMTAAAVALVWPPPSPRERMLNIQLIPPAARGEDRGSHCRVVISNASDYSLFYYSGITQPELEVECLVDGVWREQPEKEIGGGLCLLRPHEMVTAAVPMNGREEAIRTGLTFTVASWRGRTAWRMITSRLQQVLRPFSWILLRLDERSKPKSEWSEVVYSNREKDRAAIEGKGVKP